jgi:hypothetical protein
MNSKICDTKVLNAKGIEDVKGFEDEESDVLFIEESIKHSLNLPRGDEIDLLAHDDENAYFLTYKQLPTVLSKMLGFEIYKPREKKSSKNGRPKKISSYTFLLVGKEGVAALEMDPYFEVLEIPIGEAEEEEKVYVTAYKFKRKMSVGLTETKKPFEIDLVGLFKHYHDCLTPKELIERLNESYGSEWEKLHGNKKPSRVYSDRVDKEFKKNVEPMKVKPNYIG